MTEKDTSEITAGNQDKIWPLSNLRYIPKKNLIPVPYKNAGKERTCPRTGGAFSAPGFYLTKSLRCKLSYQLLFSLEACAASSFHYGTA